MNNLIKKKKIIKKNEEINSRREFFKGAIKKALPILGAVTLLNMPIISKAIETKVTGCSGSCSGYCLGCIGTCQGYCVGCIGGCKGCTGCTKTCADTCHVSCSWTSR